ncbi:MAG: hypothetical protein ABII71_05255 [Candidatus Micrarchaeota archaeon]
MDIKPFSFAAFGLGVMTGFLVVLVGILAIFVFAILGAVMGAIAGWLVDLTPFLGEAVKHGFSSVFGVYNPNLVEIGAMLGFIGGFFKNWGHGDNKCMQ